MIFPELLHTFRNGCSLSEIRKIFRKLIEYGLENCSHKIVEATLKYCDNKHTIFFVKQHVMLRYAKLFNEALHKNNDSALKAVVNEGEEISRKFEETFLHFAATNNIEMVRFLLKHG